MKHLNFLFLLLTTCFINGLAINTFEVNSGDKFLVGKGLEFFEDSTNALDLKAVFDKEFKVVESRILNLGNTSNTVWMRFNITSSSQKSIFLEIGEPMIEELQVYQVIDGKSSLLFDGGFREAFAERPISTENWLFNLDIQEGETKTIYIKGRTGFPFQFPITLSTNERFVESTLMHNLFWGLYLGVMFFAFIYNFFIYLSLKERTYLYYILYIALSVLFYLGLKGYSFMFIWPNMPSMNPLLPIIIGFTNIVITLFSFRFLNITKKNKITFYWGWTMIILFLVLIAFNFVGPYPIAAGLAQMMSMICAFLFIYTGISAWHRKVPTARYYLAAWLLFLIFVIIYLLTINNVLASNFFTTHCIFIGHMTEVLLLSFALADRINWLKADNETKQKRIITQLEENDKLQLKVNRELEQKVVARTKEVVEQRNEAIKQRERSDELLLNILPEETAEELKKTGHAETKLMQDVTVMFTDIKDFSSFAERLSPKELVSKINEIFSVYDQIVTKYNIEKIKTIGDAYMAVGGLPTENSTHTKDVIDAALEIQSYMKSLKVDLAKDGIECFEVRVGIHTGPVVAGVVGVKKFAYDVWGKTVNIASRMESTGEPNKVNISESTYEHVKDLYNFTPRGKIKAKGVEPIDMYYVDGLK